MTTKTLKYLVRPVNKYAKYNYKGYVFQWNDQLEPIPVEVPSDIAEVLLQMEGRRSACCPKRGGGPLFLEV